MRRPVLLSLLLSITALQACGTRGPLTLPPQQEKAALLAPVVTQAVAVAAPNRTNLNTTQDHAL